MAAIVGCKEAKELTLCRKGANQFSHVLITKNLDGGQTPNAPQETDEMDFETMKALLGMNDVTKAHFLTLTDEPTAKAFLAKTAEARDAEATAAKTKADEAEAAKTAAADASKSTEERLKAQLEENQKALADMRAERAAEKRDAELEKQASETAFVGYPGGSEAVLALLKTYDALPEADRTKAVDALKAHAAIAKRVGTSEIGGRDDAGFAELAKNSPASAELEKKVREEMEASGTTKSVATKKVSEMPANKALVGRAMSEQGIL